MSISLKALDITDNLSLSKKVDLRVFDGRLYICKVEDNGAILSGAEIILDSLPAAAVYGTSGEASAQVMAAQLSLDIDFANFSEADEELFKQGILDGINVEDAIVLIKQLTEGSVIIDYEIIFASTVTTAQIQAATTALSDNATVTSALQAKGGNLASASVTLTQTPTVSLNSVAPVIMNIAILPGTPSAPSVHQSWSKPASDNWNGNNGIHNTAFYDGYLYVCNRAADGRSNQSHNANIYIYKVDHVGDQLELYKNFNIQDFPNTNDGNGSTAALQFDGGDLYWFGGAGQIVKCSNDTLTSIDIRENGNYAPPGDTILGGCVSDNYLWYLDRGGASFNDSSHHRLVRINKDGSNKTEMFRINTGSSQWSTYGAYSAGTSVIVLLMSSAGAADYIFKVDENDTPFGQINSPGYISHCKFTHLFTSNNTYYDKFFSVDNGYVYFFTDWGTDSDAIPFDLQRVDISTMDTGNNATLETVWSSNTNVHGPPGSKHCGGLGVYENVAYILTGTSATKQAGDIISWPLGSTPSTISSLVAGAYSSINYSVGGTTVDPANFTEPARPYDIVANLTVADGSTANTLTKTMS